ncbi:hypothetical protein EDB84DRAFT_305165 [Lactarius hengduanensis]|nr:hypothetical protein EDB84DRAFT_305165 [Lactarius hengduanensis]
MDQSEIRPSDSCHGMAYFKGRWHNVVRWRSAAPVSDGSGRFTPSSGGKAAHPMEWTTVIDLTPLQAVLKIVRPISRQLPSESRWLWESATSKLLSKEYREATRAKQVIEQRQWDKAANRKRRGVEYFEKDIQSGVPTLMQAGREALEVEINLPTVRHVQRQITIYTLSLASSFAFLYRVFCWSFSICTRTTSFPYPYMQLVMRIQHQALPPRDKGTDKAALRPSL